MKRYANIFVYGSTAEVKKQISNEAICFGFPIKNIEFIKSGSLQMNIEFVGAKKSECNSLIEIRTFNNVPLFRVTFTDVVVPEMTQFEKMLESINRTEKKEATFVKIPNVEELKKMGFFTNSNNVDPFSSLHRKKTLEDLIEMGYVVGGKMVPIPNVDPAKTRDETQIERLEKRVAELEKTIKRIKNA